MKTKDMKKTIFHYVSILVSVLNLILFQEVCLSTQLSSNSSSMFVNLSIRQFVKTFEYTYIISFFSIMKYYVLTIKENMLKLILFVKVFLQRLLAHWATPGK